MFAHELKREIKIFDTHAQKAHKDKPEPDKANSRKPKIVKKKLILCNNRDVLDELQVLLCETDAWLFLIFKIQNHIGVIDFYLPRKMRK